MTEKHLNPNFPNYPPKKAEGQRVKDLPEHLQRERYWEMTGLVPTDAQLEMALALNLM